MGSQPTYEELKPLVGQHILRQIHGSQPTYEELKPGIHASKIARQSCSQPTYEELKHSQSIKQSKAPEVLSLPMRN